MKVICTNCGREYGLAEGEKPTNFTCECGGTLSERRSISDVRRDKVIKESKSDYKRTYDNKNKDYNTELSTEGKKQDLLRRGYTLIDENDKEFIYSKKASKLPIWVIVLVAIVLFPIGIIIGILLYMFYTETKIMKVTKDVTKPSKVDLINCPSCGKDVSINDMYCPNCGNEVKPETKLIPCPSCGKDVSKLAKSCPNCGHPFE